jgi:hypothetical protein
MWFQSSTQSVMDYIRSSVSSITVPISITIAIVHMTLRVTGNINERRFHAFLDRNISPLEERI